MKKKILAGMLAAAVTGMLLSGCGKKSEVQPEPENETLQEEPGSEVLREESEDVPAKSENGAELKEETKTDWISEKGFMITPQGDFAFTYSVHGTENYQDAVWPEDFTIQEKESTAGNVTITENLVDDHKEVVFLFKCDESGLERYYDELPADVKDSYGNGMVTYEFLRQPAYMSLCFDRDTGYRLPCVAGTGGSILGGTSIPWDAMQSMEGGCLKQVRDIYDLWGEDEAYKEAVFYTARMEKQGTERILELIVYCPADYDGAVFGVRDWPQETGQTVEKIEGFDYDRGLSKMTSVERSLEDMSGYAVDGLVDEEYFFFTFTNE